MKLGVLQFFSWPERRVDLATVYARALERIESMDRTGYDAVWLAEHHFSSFSVCPSVHMVGTLAAARTKRLRIGTAVSLAPFYHPLRLAEEVALLDLLSGGRVNWGAGRGFARVEFTAFGVPPEESVSRFHETVEIVLKAWTEAKLTFAGKHFHFEDVEVLPQTSAAAASAGMGGGEFEGGDRLGGRPRLFDPDGPALVGPEIGAKRLYYADKLTVAGFSGAGRDIPIARLVAIPPTAVKAKDVARSGAEWIVNSYLGTEHRPVMQHNFWSASVDPIQRYLDEVILHGTPDKVGDEILRLREEIGLDYLLCAPLSHQTSNQSPHRAQHRRRQLSRALCDHDARRFRSRRHARRAPLDRTGRRGRAAPGDRARGRASSGHSRGPARDAAAARFVKSKRAPGRA
jgi:alkanesulfonate monooxygenase SsuD/methylene tetrahydromethanopterin reductase-like flavin-dependent oxidoreductase (luciferase family)